MLIKFDNVWFRYKEKWIIKNADFTIDSYKVYCLVGPNGSGKTTLAKLMVGLLKPQKGNVIVKGLNTKEHPIKEIVKNIGYVFQNPDSQFFLNKVKEEIEFAQKMLGKRIDSKRYERLLDILGIKNLLDKSPFNLSVGEKMRVAIMSILSYDPEIIILDEPTLGADDKTYKVIKDLIINLKEMKKCVILISHDIDLINNVSDYIIPIKDGKVFGIFEKENFLDIIDNLYGINREIMQEWAL